jgi:CheY-like chemotaxis protein
VTATRILVVEDNPTARKLYRIMLQSEGFEVIEAPDARTALAEMAENPPALILQDLLLPDMLGLDLLTTIREMPGGREIPIVALSGFRSIMEEAKLFPLGFDAALVKPVERATLLATVRSLLPAEPRRPDVVGRGHRVLLVDDDSVQLKLVRLRLLDAGYEVTSAVNGAAALGMAIEDLPDLILSDVLMPEMDGFELCAAARAEPKLAKVPMVLMSAHFVDGHDGELGRRVGAHALAKRTPDLAEVLGAVQNALGAQATPVISPRDFPTAEHRKRLAHRLKQLAAINETLLQRCAQQAAQLTIVGGVADALTRSENVDGVLQDVLATCLDAGGISRGALFREDANGVMRPEQTVGFNEAEQATLAAAFDDFAALGGFITEGKPVALSTLFPQPAVRDFAASAGMTAAVIVPVMTDQHCTAALLLGCGDAELTEAELLAFARVIGGHIGQALALSNAFRRLSAAAAADRILFSSLDIDETLRALAELVIERMADSCEIELLDGEQILQPAIALHSDPATLEILRELRRRYPPSPDRSVRQRVARTKEPYLCSEKTDATRIAMARDDEHLRLLRAVGLRSHIVVPLLLKGRVLGILAMGTSRPGRRHGSADLALATELAGRAAIALDNARLYRQAHEASLAKDEFLATVSHELRTPLNAMLGWTRMLRGGQLSPDQQAKALETIERNAVAQAQLIADILDVSGIVAGKVQLVLHVVPLVRVVDAAADSVRLSMDAKGIHYEAEVDASISLTCDADRLQQVLWNLLSNAVKFTPRGGTIRIEAVALDSDIEVLVTDSGEGIGTAFLSRVFDRFQQVDGSVTRSHGGLGLGLAISKHIVELHGGTIDASSEGAGKGSTFRLKLPRVHAVPARTASTSRSAPPPSNRELQSGLEDLRVLVVDDELDCRELLQALLEERGARPTLAASAREAILQLDGGTYDVLVSDVAMPIEDGISLIRSIRARSAEAGGGLPALALTGYARPEDKAAALDAGFHMHLAKPFNHTELLNAVVSLARMADALK